MRTGNEGDLDDAIQLPHSFGGSGAHPHHPVLALVKRQRGGVATAGGGLGVVVHRQLVAVQVVPVISPGNVRILFNSR